jgi:mono/diheme cytochrome c family protein
MRRASLLLVIALLAALLAPGCRRPQPARAAVALARPTQYQLHLGKSVFEAYCVPCHGDAGAGDGSNSFNLDPHPRDLGDPKFQKTKTNADLMDTIRRGGAGVGLSSLMPPWGHTLNDRQIDAVVVYLRSLKR